MGYPVTEDTVRNWWHRGIRIKSKSRTRVVRLMGYRVGGRIYFSSQSLNKFLQHSGIETFC